jgi:hypothetical protein
MTPSEHTTVILDDFQTREGYGTDTAHGIWDTLTSEEEMVIANPSLELTKQARELFGEHREIGCFVSCGASISKTVIDVENTIPTKAYFRFAPRDMKLNGELQRSDSAHDLSRNRMAARRYMKEEYQVEMVKELSAILKIEASAVSGVAAMGSYSDSMTQ